MIGGADFARTCAEAVRLRLAAVTIVPADLDDAARLVRDTPVTLATVIDPAGGATTAVKQYAARDALRRGARIVECAIHARRMLSREFRSVESELQQLAAACHEAQAIFRLAVPRWESNAEEFEILTARLARRAGVDALSTDDLASAQRLLGLAREGYRVYLRTLTANSDSILGARAAGCAGVIVASETPENLLASLVSRSSEAPG